MEFTEVSFGSLVRGTLFTIPTSFNVSQHKDTKDKSVIAGMNMLCIINDLTSMLNSTKLCSVSNESNCILLW